MPDLILKRGREKPVLERHPWIFSGSVAALGGQPLSGETVAVRDHEGNFLAWAGYSPDSQIRARVWSWDPSESIGPGFFSDRIARAVHRRNKLNLPGTNAYRLVHAESDGLPGLIVDRYENILVVQFLFVGVEFWRESILDSLESVTQDIFIFERSDVPVRKLEGLPERKGHLRGSGGEGPVRIMEIGLEMAVDIQNGQKTGYYLDQRDTRARVHEIAEEKNVLDCYCYTGSMALNAVLGGCRLVTAVDSSENALTLARHNADLNKVSGDKIRWIQGDVPTVLRGFRDRASRFDLIVLDPPNFAPTSAQAHRAARAYKDINLLAFKLLAPGGVLVTCSCSGGISPELFQKIIFSAALDAKVDAQVIGWLHQGEDHPVSLTFPEGAYLKGLICRVD
ncbi:MAG TPA: class I SAM-dependent methyltransferase [Anaerolineales bacterium]|nr:class I SAM-dependent methyltransferase [Anaerolineales bacterium]